jgi:hypothetical protein
MRKSFLNRQPGILVADHLSGRCDRVRPTAPARPSRLICCAGRPVSVTCLGAARPQRWRLATTGVDQIATTPTNDSYMTTGIAAAITAN